MRFRNYFESSIIWDQSHCCASKRLEMRAIWRWLPFFENAEKSEVNLFWWARISTSKLYHCFRRFSTSFWILTLTNNWVSHYISISLQMKMFCLQLSVWNRRNHSYHMSGCQRDALESTVTCLGRIHVQTQNTVTEPNGRCHSLGGTLNEVLKKKKSLTLLIFIQ